MNRIQIIFLTGSLRMGGTERNILHLATGLPKDRFAVEVWSDYGGEAIQTKLREAGVSCRALKGAPSTGKWFLTRILRHNLPYQWRLFRLLRKNRGAVIHAFGFPMIYYAVLIGRLAGCRRMIFAVQDWDVWKKSWIYRFLDRRISRLAWRGVCDGEGARRLAVERQGMDTRRLMTIYDGVNTEEIRPARAREATRRELGLDPNRPTAGMVARLDMAKKGQDVFIRAAEIVARSHPEAQFLIVGDGPDRAAVERLIAELPEASRPVLAGFRSDLADVLAALDILVIPSRWESVPKILLEAMWLGVPVAAAQVGDIAEVLDDTCGRLVPADDAARLAGEMAVLLSDPPLRRALGEAARRRIAEGRLTLNDSIEAYQRLYREAAGDKT